MARKRSSRSPGKFTEYVFLRFVAFGLLLIPFRLRAFLLERLALILGRLSSNARTRVAQNIKQAFPEKSTEWHEQIARQNFLNLGRMAAEFLQGPRINDRFFKKWFVLKPDAKTHKRCYDGGGILVLGHLGNWEWKGVAITRTGSRDLYVLAKRQGNFWSNKWIEDTRGKQNIKLLYTDESPRAIFRLLKEKTLIGFISDQDAGKSGEFVPFLGRLASTYQGPALFARKADVPLYFLWSYHDEKRRLVYELQEFPRPNLDPRADPEAWDRAFTISWVKLLEEKIRLHPGDYYWIHRRWHTQPADPAAIWKSWNLPMPAPVQD
ncbi:MAG: lauroyl acyltransferase [Leptospiraceae bacterium]|nr:lauroyl acyltransferase [Leptospiraceae bacterium]